MSNGSTSKILEHYSNKEVAFRYDGCDLSFFLSQGLFSSYDIDRGSALLLKVIAQSGLAAERRLAVDIGCGTGVLGLSLKKRHPELKVLLQDRDALAVHFSRESAARNKLSGLEFSGGLLFEGCADRQFDLIISNWPAKAGSKALSAFFHQAREHSCPGVILAVVVVQPLREEALGFCRDAGWNIEHSEESKDHIAFLASLASDAEAGNQKSGAREKLLTPYLRSPFHGSSYSIDTVHGIGGFDTLPYQLGILSQEAGGLFNKQRGRHIQITYRNPGQGHGPMILLKAAGAAGVKIDRIQLESSDRLQLLITEHNLHAEGVTAESYHSPSPMSVEEKQEASALGVMEVTAIPGADLREEAQIWAESRIAAGGIAIFLGKSSHLARICQGLKGFHQRKSRKFRGYRMAVYQREA